MSADSRRRVLVESAQGLSEGRLQAKRGSLAGRRLRAIDPPCASAMPVTMTAQPVVPSPPTSWPRRRPEERFEHTGGDVARHARAVVAHLEHARGRPATRALTSTRASAPACCKAFITRLVAICRSRLSSPEHHHRARLLERDARARSGDLRVGDGVGGQHGSDRPGALERRPSSRRASSRKLLDEHAHARRLLLDAAHGQVEILGALAGAAAEQLGVAADRAESGVRSSCDAWARKRRRAFSELRLW